MNCNRGFFSQQLRCEQVKTPTIMAPPPSVLAALALVVVSRAVPLPALEKIAHADNSTTTANESDPGVRQQQHPMISQTPLFTAAQQSGSVIVYS